MYQRLSFNRTKNRYIQILNEALNETKELIEISPSIAMYQSIFNQITDIKENIVEKKNQYTRDEIYARYSLGSIAVKNFDLEHDEYAQRLSDIFGGAIRYHDSPEGGEAPLIKDKTPPKSKGGWSVFDGLD